MLLRASFVLLLASLVSCNKAHEPSEPERPHPAAPPAAGSLVAPPVARQSFGAPLGTSPSATLAEVLKAPDKFADQSVTVAGEVRRACTRKGCWMELAESQDASSPGCRVTFKDYGFFVPLDSAGSKARVEARVESKLVKASTVTHLEEEGAKFAAKEPDGSAREVRLVATGVEMWR